MDEGSGEEDSQETIQDSARTDTPERTLQSQVRQVERDYLQLTRQIAMEDRLREERESVAAELTAEVGGFNLF